MRDEAAITLLLIELGAQEPIVLEKVEEEVTEKVLEKSNAAGEEVST